MNKHLEEAITQVSALPEKRQDEAADLLFDFLGQDASDVYLTSDQIAEIERSLAETEPYASDAEVRAVFQRLTK